MQEDETFGQHSTIMVALHDINSVIESCIFILFLCLGKVKVKAKFCHIRWMTYFWRMCKWKWHSVHLAYFTSVVCVFGKEIMLYKCRYGERINIKCLKHLKTFYSYLTFLTMVIGNEAKFTKISGLFIMQWCLYEWCPIKLIDKWYGFLKL